MRRAEKVRLRRLASGFWQDAKNGRLEARATRT